MNTLNSQTEPIQAELDTANSLRKLYFTRAAFSILWVVLVFAFAKTSVGIASFLFIIYPAWDVVGTLFDIRANKNNASSKMPQIVNAVISTLTTIAVAVALQTGIPEALMVFGAWAILTGLIQFLLALSRRKALGGQWPMIISGAQSVLGGSSFIYLAHAPNQGITSLAGYAAFGAFYYILTAWRLGKKPVLTTTAAAN